MKNLSLTVIIPTYNRKNTLKKCLNALFNQTHPKTDYEIIVVDDGSTDETEELVKSLLNDSPCMLRYFKQDNKGPAAARNVGIKNANGKIILFTGDDIIAISSLLEEHLTWHQKNAGENVAVLGYVTWSSDIIVTPFMRYLEESGLQFGYSLIRDPQDVSYNFFYTSNVSVKRKFLLKYGLFDEEFPYAAYEDIELGYRLKKKGMVLKYNKKAIGYHYHYTSLSDACRRMIKNGKSYEILAKKKGENLNSFHFNRSLLRRILRKGRFIIYYPIAKFYEKKSIKENIFRCVLQYCWYIGFKENWNRRKQT